MSELRAHYLRIWKAADEILRQPDNPCQFETVDGKTSCRLSRKGWGHQTELCCGGCTHLGPQGCTVQSLGCKLGWCYCASSSIQGTKLEDHPTFAKIAALRQEAIQLGVPMRFRASYEENFR